MRDRVLGVMGDSMTSITSEPRMLERRISNQRAELGVKIAKRLIRENTDQSGSLDSDSFARSLLNYRNTPCRDTKLSPAEIIYGRPIKDHLPNLPAHYKPREEWTLSRERRLTVLLNVNSFACVDFLQANQNLSGLWFEARIG